MRRICCFCECWESGGIESFLNNVLLHMELSEMEVDIVAACMKESIFTMGLETKGIHFIELSGKLRSLENYLAFRKLVRERQYDVIHFNLFQGLSLYYVQIAKEEGVPVRIAHSHGAGLRNSWTKQLKLMIHRFCIKLWASAATERWACSNAAAHFLFSDIESFCMIPNGIEAKRFCFNAFERNKIRSELKLTNNYVIGNVGRFSSEKNQSFLLDVFVQLIKMRPNSRLLLVGDGLEKSILEKKSKQLGIAEYVMFYGISEHIERLLWAMDVFVFSSLFEGLGLACIEAQAAGLPVICSEGVPEEAQITPLVKTVNLNLGAQRWAEELLQWNPEVSRTNGVRMVREAGFDISDVSDLISKRYGESRYGAT